MLMIQVYHHRSGPFNIIRREGDVLDETARPETYRLTRASAGPTVGAMAPASEKRSADEHPARWLLLIHQLPPKPDYLRVKVRRRLRKLGAVPLKQTVYVLPNTDEALEDLQWLRQEIETDGGSAVIASADFIEGMADQEVEALFAGERAEVTAEKPTRDAVRPGQLWVTRENVHVDRIASAWLIKRFIDPKARFKFVVSRGYSLRAGEIGFDMTGGTYTHHGADCTFQTLIHRFGLKDRALRVLGEIIHDIDCKDELFGRPETVGVASMIRGLVRSTDDDDERLERGRALFNDLYANYARR
jgi:hypothetical protein